MPYQLADFIAQLHLETGIHNVSTTKAAELNAIAALLATDPTRHDKTIETPPVGLQFGVAGNTRYTNDVLRLINRGKGGNLTPLNMGNAITNELAKLFAPVNTSPPIVSGTGTVGQILTSTVGNWTYVPTSYLYQWRRNSNIIGAAPNSPSYTLVALDSGTNISCQVTAINAAGSTMGPASNAIAVT
jgi:hypothetical protein